MVAFWKHPLCMGVVGILYGIVITVVLMPCGYAKGKETIDTTLYPVFNRELTEPELAAFAYSTERALKERDDQDRFRLSIIPMPEAGMVVGCKSVFSKECFRALSRSLRSRHVLAMHVEPFSSLYRIEFLRYDREEDTLVVVNRYLSKKGAPSDTFGLMVDHFLSGELPYATLSVDSVGQLEPSLSLRIQDIEVADLPARREYFVPGEFEVEIVRGGEVVWRDSVELSLNVVTALEVEPLSSGGVRVYARRKPKEDELFLSWKTSLLPEAGQQEVALGEDRVLLPGRGLRPGARFWESIPVGTYLLMGGGAALVTGYIVMQATEANRRRPVSYQATKYFLLGTGLALLASGIGWFTYEAVLFHQEKQRLSVSLTGSGIQATMLW